jgi:hypothetical protein
MVQQELSHKQLTPSYISNKIKVLKVQLVNAIQVVHKVQDVKTVEVSTQSLTNYELKLHR